MKQFYMQLSALWGNSHSCRIAKIKGLALVLFLLCTAQTLQAQQVYNFNYTGSTVEWTVPAGVALVSIETYGAQGGNTIYGQSGGKGGYAKGTLAVTPGQVLYINVGQQGQLTDAANAGYSTNAFNGGGKGYTWNNAFGLAGGGGGASDIRVGGNSLAHRVLVAGGGGGSTGNGCIGGSGGGLIGSGDSCGSSSGGTQTTGGNGGFNGSLGNGGNALAPQTDGWVGGGGGGFYGGGSGTSHWGGGGGSSYIGGVTSGSTQSGIQSGNGKVVITSLYSATITETKSIACAGDASGELTATVTGGTAPYTYSWSPTGGTGAVATNLTPGTYTVTVKDAAGNTTSATQEIKVNDTEAPVITKTGSKVINIPAGQSSNWIMYTYNFTDPLPTGAKVTGVTLAYSGRDQNGGGTGQWTRMIVSGKHIGGNQYFGYNQNFTINYTGVVPDYVYGGNNYMRMDFDTWPAWVAYFNGGTMTIHYEVATLPNITAQCSVTVNSIPTATDNCAGEITGTTTDPLTYTTQGTHVITWKFDDGNGNIATATQNVIIKDETNPTITAPAAVVVNNDSGKAIASGVELGTPVTADNCEVSTVTNNAPATFPIGNTTITWTVTDGVGNATTATQVVTVADDEKPVPTIANLPTITDECSATVTAPTATDNVAGTITATTTDPVEYLGQGTYTITWTYSDGNGNTTTQTQQVIVKDETKPVFAAVTPITTTNDANKCGAVVTYTMPTATDNCKGGEGKKVLLIWDEMNVNTTSLRNALVAAGLEVTLSATSETGYNGTNPSLTGFDAVIHLNGTTPYETMPAAGQSVLVDFVITKGKTYVTNEWSAYEAGSMAAMNDIIVLERVSGTNGEFTYTTVASQAVHPILKGIPNSFKLPMGAANVGGVRTYSSNQPIILMTSEHGAAVAVREFSNGGKAVGFQHAGNYLGYATLSDVNVQKLYINAVKYSNGNSTTITQTAGLASGTLFPIGKTTNTFVATDAAGNTTTTSFDVTVTDTQKPTVVTQNITVNLDATGNATITSAQINNGSTDNCSIPATGYSLDKSTFTCENVGPNTVTLTVTDVNGNTSSETALVTVKDVTAPLAKAKDLTVQLDANGAAVVTPEMVDNGSSDICGTVTLKLSKTVFDCSNLGANTVTLTVEDKSGNVSTATATITVKDEIAPKAVAKDLTVTLDATGNATITVAQVNNGSSDNCEIETLTLSKSAFDCTNVGKNEVITLTVTDKSGNAHKATAIVTVIDETLPVALAKNITVQLDATGNATIEASDINNGSSDACGIKSMTLSKSTFDCTNVGNNSITLTVTDNNGNVATATAIVNVEDKVIPIAKAQHVTIELDVNGVATITAADIDNGSSDACGAVTLDLSKTTFGCENVGANTVTLTVTDKNDNKATVDATITVVDNLAPVARAKNITVQLDATGNATITATQVNNGSSDNCGIKTMSLDKTTFDCTAIGESEVILTVTDVNNNTHTATAIVTVEDKVAPTAITQNITVQLDATGNATIVAGDIDNGSSDACGIKSMSLDKTAFDCSHIGDNTVILTVTDNNDNVATKTATVTVKDNIAPTAVTKNITVKLDAAGKATIVAADVDNGSSDVCGSVKLTINKSAFDCSNIGDNTVILTVTDASDNETSEEATVTIVDDLAPVVLTQNITVKLDATGNATITTAQIDNGSYDNCGIDEMLLDVAAFTCEDAGVKTVTLTVKDVNGNEASKEATVTIVDEIAPAAFAKNITAELDKNGTVTITATQINDNSTDNCGIETLELDKDSFDCSNVATTNEVILTVIDKAGNKSTATATVTIVDNNAPTITAPADLVLDVDAGKTTASNVNLGIPSTADNCDAADVTATPDKPTDFEYPAGVTIVIWTAIDASGNETTATQTVTVRQDITSVTTPSTINVPIRTVYANVPLPETVEVTYTNGEKEAIGVTWEQGTYNGLVAGTYVLTGQLIPAPNTTNRNSKVATISVVVEPNKAPTNLAFSATTFAPEAKADDVIGTLTTTDADDTEFVYTLVAGEGDAGNGLFEIRDDKVYLKSNNGLSGKTTFSIRVRSTDPYQNTIEKVFTLNKEPYTKPVDKLKIVNAFSPNGDGINDTWTIPELRFYNSVEIEVFDRAGVRLFHTTDPEKGWDGRGLNGQVLTGAFFYIVQVKDINLVKKGVVTILKK